MIDFYELRSRILNSQFECLTRAEIWHLYLSFISDGSALEFGVWNGRSINYMADVRPKASFFGFDSFEGLPEAWIRGHPIGHFKTDISNIKWKDNIRLFIGLFSDSIPEYKTSDDFGKKIEGIHIDCDLGSSTETILDELSDRILTEKPLILFDELYNYQGYEDHEFKAFLNWVNQNNVKFNVLARNVNHQQALIQIL
jgi:hypothetical protein